MLFRTQLLSGNKDVDSHILVLLETKDLISVMKCDKYTNNLTECDTFWENRVNYWYQGAVINQNRGLSLHMLGIPYDSKFALLKYRYFYIDLYKGKANAEYNCIKDVLDYLIKIGTYDDLCVKCSGIACKETYQYLTKNNIEIAGDDLVNILAISYPDPKYRLYHSLKWFDEKFEDLEDFSDYIGGNKDEILNRIKDFDTRSFKFLTHRGLTVSLSLLDKKFPVCRDTQIRMITMMESGSDVMSYWFHSEDNWTITFKKSYELINLFKKHSIILKSEEINQIIESLLEDCKDDDECRKFLEFLKKNNLIPNMNTLKISSHWKEEIKKLFS